MSAIFGPDIIDLYIVAGLIAVIVITYAVSRVGLLPKKSLPYITAAAAGAVGYGLFSRWRASKLLEEYNKAKEEARKVKEELDKMNKEYAISQKKRDEIIAEEEKKIAAYQKQILMVNAQGNEKKIKIDEYNNEQLDAEFANFLANAGK